MKRGLFLSALTVCGLALPLMFANTNKTQAVTITDNGEYALVMSPKQSDTDATINGSKEGKILKFNFDIDEDSVELFELTQGITPYNGENEFSGWALSSSDSTPAPGDTILKKEDFSSKGKLEGIEYEKGKIIYALFNGNQLQDSETYGIVLNASGGKINGKDSYFSSGKISDFQTMDLSQYIPQRDGYTFCDWGRTEIFNGNPRGEIITSIDKDYLENYYLKNGNCNLTLYALYKSNNFYGPDENGNIYNPDIPSDQRLPSYVLILDANGGTIDEETSKRYDYDDGGNNYAMPIFHYKPGRSGYKFKGWNSKKDGTGKHYDLIQQENWRTDGGDFDRDLLKNTGHYYTYLTLYATWEGTPIDDDDNTEESGKEISSITDIKGSVQFLYETENNYTLEIRKLDIPKELADKNVKFLVDINLLCNGQEIAEVNGRPLKIKLEIPEELRSYNNYQVVYIGRVGQIKETLPATLKDGYIIFETSHLSQYGVVATNVEENTPNGEKGSSEEENGNNSNEANKTNETDESSKTSDDSENSENPLTGDAITTAITLFTVASFGISAFPLLRKKK